METLVPVATSRAVIAVAAAWTAVCPAVIAAALGCDGEPDAGGAPASVRQVHCTWPLRTVMRRSPEAASCNGESKCSNDRQ